MNKNNINIEQLRDLLDYYTKKVAEITSVLDTLSRIDVSPLIQDTAIVNSNNTGLPSFNTSWTQDQQVAYCIEHIGRFVIPFEIERELKKFNTELNAEQINTFVPVTLNRLKKTASVVSYKPVEFISKGKSHVWGFKKWLDEDGKPLLQFKPIEIKKGLFD